jgi:uncharacterized membrane protein YobD (UPF0266 family)
MVKKDFCVNLYIIYLNKKFHMPSFNGSLVTDIKLKAKYWFGIAVMLMLYTNYLNESNFLVGGTANNIIKT